MEACTFYIAYLFKKIIENAIDQLNIGDIKFSQKNSMQFTI